MPRPGKAYAMQKPAQPPYSHLFTVRLWLEELGEGQQEWRGKLKNVANGDERYFRDWAAAGELLCLMATGRIAGRQGDKVRG